MNRVAYGNMEFVRCNNTKPRIQKFPPELVPYNSYVDGHGGFWSILDGVNHAGCSREQHRNDQDWNHSPSQFNLRAPIALRRLALCVGDSATELRYGVYQ